MKPLRVRITVALSLAMLTAAGCDPVVNIAGANFPAWLLCTIVGAIAAAAARPLFVAGGIERYLGPLLLIYPCLAVVFACIVYLIFFNRL